VRRALVAALPVVVLVGFALLWRVAHGHHPLVDLRILYGAAAIPLVALVGWANGRVARPVSWLPRAIVLFVGIELALGILHLEPAGGLANRIEHFSALFLLTTLLLLSARVVVPASEPSRRGLVAGVATAAGFANEGIEYLLRWGTPFFTPDTIYDLVTNTVAVVAALAFDMLRRG
jgi:hypothetical protein